MHYDTLTSTHARTHTHTHTAHARKSIYYTTVPLVIVTLYTLSAAMPHKSAATQVCRAATQVRHDTLTHSRRQSSFILSYM